ncbi:GH3 auxin-responsive promoter family protein [Lentimicrobium sp. S6]|uniref:GH3 family domain-containing protein n=1 Tax=Lentimicrobium sp. S6 TaxID=2735872 RepID=UPI001557EE6C|nr:GH3 auxin-responsive promoter family protein [Lentimicrobium sp. S6]NPD46961.1 GH3 auxin-responsive promoter [Lentimicrobium sp. S6]
MPLLGTLIKKAYQIKDRPALREAKVSPIEIQYKELKKLLSKAEITAFGEHYHFSKILHSKQTIQDFQNTIPVFDYSKMFQAWWYRSLNGEAYVSWPGKVKYFALTSGTSEASSKQIPVTGDMLKSIKKASLRQLVSASRYDFPIEFFQKGILMIGGSTHLNLNGSYLEGDLSGISAGNIPFWFQHFYKPGRRISKERDWATKLDEIVKSAPKWDIGVIVGVPAWIQIILERIIETHKLNSIHDIWPNLNVYVHSGVAFAPYKKSFDKLFARPIIYNESYLASEGYIAYQNQPEDLGMKLILDNGIFYEFVPFNDQNFDDEGNINANAKVLHIGQVNDKEEYALLLSNNSGAWRYLIGDTVKFNSVEKSQIIITGRTKHFLSICGEHLSMDNINRAMELTQQDLDIEVGEFTVLGVEHGSLWAHEWHVGTDCQVEPKVIKEALDNHLNTLNDDYRVERMEAIKDVTVKIIPTQIFAKWMKINGKEGGANKFPRVLKNKIKTDWLEFLKQEGY